MTEYHNPYSCYSCGGKCTVEVTDSLDGHMLECDSTCSVCGKIHPWATGFYLMDEDSQPPKCETYTNGAFLG
ncbi:hypothetical protein GCM10023116_43420 [Kistimonas scapharcae]|uniref:Uncharacterized protein n=1 Tax=Kistimonas scapharcae TaxID=1036133 RepID=A0ABP8V951_9GAMM